MTIAADAAGPPHGTESLEPFVLPTAIATAMFEHLAESLPDEGVGLIGVAPQRLNRARKFYPGTNVDQSPLRYTMAPKEVLAALRDMAAIGLQLGAIVHSHPTSAAVPSATDLREAYYDGVLMLIADLSVSQRRFRGWRIAGHGPRVTEVEVRVVLTDG